MPKGYPRTEEGRRKQREILQRGAFKKGQVANPKGRGARPQTMTMFIQEMKEKGYEVPSANTVSEAFMYIATLPEDELKAILSDKSRPMMQRIIAKGILANKGLDVLERIVDRAYGKIQRIDLTSKGEQIKQPDALQVHFVDNAESYKKILEEIQKKKEEKDREPDKE